MVGALDVYAKSRDAPEKRIENDAADTTAMRNSAFVYAAIGSVHADYVKISAGQARQTHPAEAKENYRRALDVLLKTERLKALSEFDRKNLEEVRTALERLEKTR